MKLDYLSYLYNFVLITSRIYNIDESHSLKHSMDVYKYANKIYNAEVLDNQYLLEHKRIIDTSAILHDMCDKKYMNQTEGVERIKNYLEDYMPYNDIGQIVDVYQNNEIKPIVDIISTMSYSTVKKNGFPNLGPYQLAYNIVREADLLSSYDFDRCIMYKMYVDKYNYKKAVEDAIDVFENRVFKYHSDKLFTTKYGIHKSYILRTNAIKHINIIKKLVL
jgi:HD superfamily phosphodiesterase